MTMRPHDEVAVLGMDSVSEVDELITDFNPPRFGRRAKVAMLVVGVLACGCVALRATPTRTMQMNTAGVEQNFLAMPPLDVATKDDEACHANCLQTKNACLSACDSKFPVGNQESNAHMQCCYPCGAAWIQCQEVCDEVDQKEVQEEVENNEISTIKAEEQLQNSEIQNLKAEEKKIDQEKEELKKEEPLAVTNSTAAAATASTAPAASSLSTAQLEKELAKRKASTAASDAASATVPVVQTNVSATPPGEKDAIV